MRPCLNFVLPCTHRPRCGASQCAQVARRQHHAQTHSQHGCQLPRMQDDGTVTPECQVPWTNLKHPYEMVKTMRASVLALGPLLARFGQAQGLVAWVVVPLVLARSINTSKVCKPWVRKSMVEHGYMVASLAHGRTRLKGARIATDMVTVTGTENFLNGCGIGRGRNCFRECSPRA